MTRAVNGELTTEGAGEDAGPMSRKRGPVETPEYQGMVRRMIRAHGRRVAKGADPIDFADMLKLQAELDEALRDAAQGLRERGHSWADIAAATGTSRQGAQQRFGRRN